MILTTDMLTIIARDSTNETTRAMATAILELRKARNELAQICMDYIDPMHCPVTLISELRKRGG